MEVWGPDDLNVGGAMLDRVALPADTAESVFKLTRWVRDANGGVPYEEPQGNFFAYQWPDLNAVYSIPGANQSYHNQHAVHMPPKRIEKGHFQAATDIHFGKNRLTALAAQSLQKPLSLDIWTDKDFNIWDDASSPLTLHTQIANIDKTLNPVELSWWARDYDGTIVAQGKTSKVLSRGESWDSVLKFPAPQRGILFVEVDAKSDNNQLFRRTNLAVLPPYDFTSGKESIFGMAADFYYPSKPAMVKLLQRLGVRWLRNTRLSAEEAARAGIYQDFHSNIKPEEYTGNPAKRREWILEQLQKADKDGAVYWEFGNEWNMKGGILWPMAGAPLSRGATDLDCGRRPSH